GIDISSNNQISIDTKIIQKKLKSGNGINISDKNDTVSIKNNRLTGIMVLATLHGATHYSYYFGFFTLYTKVTSGIWRVYISTHMLESIDNSTPPELLEYYDNKIISIDGENLNTNQYKSNGRISMFLDIHISDTTDDISKKKLHIKINNNEKIPIHKIIWD
ncbi:hypothetical protein, partial [Xenorhabdus szentirmaii]|uniref:hypothetical protein n=1 Tax=Xenorhabdus szentirmaii TaxID=290112 RepID=UPI001991D42F